MKLEIDDALMAALVPGAKMRYAAGKRASELRHIRAIVDQEYVVYKVWWPHHQRWEYKVEWLYGFYLDWESGLLTLA